jgi:hypothetical protein
MTARVAPSVVSECRASLGIEHELLIRSKGPRIFDCDLNLIEVTRNDHILSNIRIYSIVNA